MVVQWVVAVKTLYRTPGNNADAYLNRSRLLFTFIGLGCGALVCYWAWQLAGRIGAFTATARQFLDRVPNHRIEKPFDAQHLRVFVNDRVR